MNMEELQVVMDGLVALGVEGKSAFIWWLLLDKALPALVLLGIAATAACVGVRVTRIVVGDVPALKFLGGRWGLWSCGGVAPSERVRIEHRLARMEELYRIHGEG